MIVGIDLGTTNSLVSFWRHGKAELIPNSLGKYLTPSVVGLDDNKRVITGQAAKERLITHPEITQANFKRYMGTEKELNLGKQAYRAEELSALLLKSLKADAEEYLDSEIEEAIITVPAYFNDSQRKATKIAGEMAGFKVERLLNEPTAAALAYGLHNQKECRYLIFDLGGGTFDISIVEYFEGILEVHASSGDNFLGGEDFAEIIYKHIISTQPQLNELNNCDKLDAKTKQLIWRKAEQLKKKLSDTNKVEIDIVIDEQIIKINFDENQFTDLADDLLKRITIPIRQALRDSKFKASDLDQIVMVGGATRMPVVRKLATRLFQRFPLVDIDPDTVVAIGAAIQTGLKSRDQALDDTVMTDVCPYTLGVEVAQGSQDNLQAGYFLPIIERNSFIPVSRVETVYTVHDNQTQINVSIYQGESMMVKDNVFLGSLIAKVPKSNKGEEAIDIRFTYDINGLLEVEVTIVSTHEKQSITIEKTPGLLSAEEIQERLKKLAKLKIHPREQLPNQTLIHRAERVYKESLGEIRQVISQALSEFLTILNQQDEREIREARKKFEQFLNEIEKL